MPGPAPNEFLYKNASTVAFDPVSANRNSTRGVLYSIGFRELEAFGDLEDAERYLAGRFVDLFVAELTGATGRVCRLISRIRRGEAGANPFMVVIVTAWDASRPLIQAAVQAGADDIITRPFSITQLTRRLNQQIEARKQFVVTSDYIGPDRRRDPTRAGGGTNLIDVPNSFRARVAENRSSDSIAAEIGAMRHKVGLGRMRALAQRIAITAHLLTDRMGDCDLTYVDPDEIRDLQRVCEELMMRAEGSPFGSISDLCLAALKVCERLAANQAGADSNLEMLGQVASAIQVTLNPERDETEMAGEIADTVRNLKARRA